MCLSVAVSRPDDVLAKGEHVGFEWNVVHNGSGYRCGYVKVTPGHPWFGKNDDNIGADVHGGITFAEADVPCDHGGEDNGWWLGFDCAHSGDAVDESLPGAERTRYVRMKYPMPVGYETVRDQAYVEAECRSLCEQAAKTRSA